MDTKMSPRTKKKTNESSLKPLKDLGTPFSTIICKCDLSKTDMV